MNAIRKVVMKPQLKSVATRNFVSRTNPLRMGGGGGDDEHHDHPVKLHFSCPLFSPLTSKRRLTSYFIASLLFIDVGFAL